jgi:hypothetical protein
MGCLLRGKGSAAGRDAPAAVVHSLFDNLADGEVARHIPRVWDTVTPEAATAARERGSVAALRRILGDLADTPGAVRAADLALKAATGARTEGRALFAAVRTLPVPTERLVEDLEPLAAVLVAAGSQQAEVWR